MHLCSHQFYDSEKLSEARKKYFLQHFIIKVNVQFNVTPAQSTF